MTTTFFDQTRRSFLKVGLTALAATPALTVVTPALAAMPRMQGSRALSFHNLHTDEKLHVTYWKDGKYDRSAWERINHILRDHYSGETYPMNLKLMDTLVDLQRQLHHEGPIEVVSGYRSPETNMMLARYTDGVAKHSYHMKGMAIDLRMQGVALPKIHRTALAMKRGGVGYYPDSDFVHVDVGPVRTWSPPEGT